MLAIDDKRIEEMNGAVIRYFEERLSRNHTLSDLFPSREMIYNSAQVDNIKDKFEGKSFEYFDLVVNDLLEKHIIIRYSDKFPDQPGFPNHFSYVGDLEIIAENHLDAIRSDDY